jgi:hypothetical protein
MDIDQPTVSDPFCSACLVLVFSYSLLISLLGTVVV